jgi:hypothetical protein
MRVDLFRNWLQAEARALSAIEALPGRIARAGLTIIAAE